MGPGGLGRLVQRVSPYRLIMSHTAVIDMDGDHARPPVRMLVCTPYGGGSARLLRFGEQTEMLRRHRMPKAGCEL